jgi:hypothetical protein
MAQAGIPQNVAAFVASQIGSVEQLEVLLFLHGRPDEAWTAEAVSQKLRTNAASTLRCLRELAATSLAVESGGRFQLTNDRARRELVDELARTHATYRVRLIELIFRGSVARTSG